MYDHTQKCILSTIDAIPGDLYKPQITHLNFSEHSTLVSASDNWDQVGIWKAETLKKKCIVRMPRNFIEYSEAGLFTGLFDENEGYKTFNPKKLTIDFVPHSPVCSHIPHPVRNRDKPRVMDKQVLRKGPLSLSCNLGSQRFSACRKS